MRVLRRPTTTTPEPKQTYETWYLWTEGGVVDTMGRIFRAWRATDDGELDMDIQPFQGSLSKVYHAEPVRVTWYADTLWREETAQSDVTYEVRPDSVPQTAPPNKCGSEKSSRLPLAR